MASHLYYHYVTRYYLKKIKLDSPFNGDDLIDPLAISLGLKSAVPHSGHLTLHTAKIRKTCYLEKKRGDCKD